MGDIAALVDRLLAAHRDLAALDHHPLYDDPLPPWTGPASEEDIRETEARLRASLPAGFVEYLRTVNGQHLISGVFGPMYDCRSLRWLRDDADWLQYWTQTEYEGEPIEDLSEAEHLACRSQQDSVKFRNAYLPELLQIGADFEGAMYLLNPKVVDADGEWEAWAFANWYPGAIRFRSFEGLLDSELEDSLETLRLLRLPFDREAVLARAVAGAREIMKRDECDAWTACWRFEHQARAAGDDGIKAWPLHRDTGHLLYTMEARLTGRPRTP